MFPIPFLVHEMVNVFGIFQIIRQCYYETSLPFLAFRRSEEIDCKDVRYRGWLPYEGKTGEVLSTPERQMPGKKQDREGTQ